MSNSSPTHDWKEDQAAVIEVLRYLDADPDTPSKTLEERARELAECINRYSEHLMQNYTFINGKLIFKQVPQPKNEMERLCFGLVVHTIEEETGAKANIREVG